jgi:hypothetical protein
MGEGLGGERAKSQSVCVFLIGQISHWGINSPHISKLLWVPSEGRAPLWMVECTQVCLCEGDLSAPRKGLSI